MFLWIIPFWEKSKSSMETTYFGKLSFTELKTENSRFTVSSLAKR